MNESREIASVPDRPAATNGGGTDAAADISLQGVTKHYPGVVIPAVSEIDLEIKRGEFFSLLGPSGSGKTTTLRLIAGFERPTVGRVFLAGKDVTELPPFKRDVNTVFQNYALFPHMTVERNVAYPLKMAKVAKGEITTRVGEALELVGMRGFEKRLPHQLSGGQRQRIALARALVNRPAVLLLDEPLGALDLKLRQQMQFVLKELQREVEISFVYVTHDQGEALAMSDRLAVMRDGQIEQIGRPADVYYEPATRFVAGFIGKTNLIDCEIESTGGGWVAVHNGIRLPLDGDFKAGAATASIRNEAIELRHAEGAGSPGPDADGRGVIPAVIEEMVFLGEGREILVQAGDAKFTVRVPAERKERFARGDRVEMVVDPKDVTILYE